MFNIELLLNKSATNFVNKETNSLKSVSGVLKRGTSIIDPVVIIQCDAADTWRTGCNYAYISSFGRYYYVTDIIAVDGVIAGTDGIVNNLWEFHMHVDVLMTYKEQIAQQTAVVARQEREYNLMLDDGFFMSYQNPKIQTKLFSNATPFETQEFVLIVAGS